MKQLGIAVAMTDGNGSADTASAATDPLSLEWLAGSWVSEPRNTDLGPARFEFRMGIDGRFETIGRSISDPDASPYRREGPYRLEGSRLSSPAIHEGEPVELRRQGEELILIVDESLAFQLRRAIP